MLLVLVYANVCTVRSVEVLLREFCTAASKEYVFLPALQQLIIQLMGKTASGQKGVVQQQPAWHSS